MSSTPERRSSSRAEAAPILGLPRPSSLPRPLGDLAVALCLMLCVGCRNHAVAPEDRVAAWIEAEIATLRRIVVPSRGTAKVDVDAVYGPPEVIPELRGKGSPADYPMHVYQPLPPGRMPFRAFLYVTYREDRVHRAGVNHLCVTKGRLYRIDGSDAPEIARENRGVLRDLLEIREKFAERLAGTPWNRTDPEGGAGEK